MDDRDLSIVLRAWPSAPARWRPRWVAGSPEAFPPAGRPVFQDLDPHL